MSPTEARSILLVIVVGILLAGCGGRSNGLTAALRPHSANTVTPPAMQPTVAPANSIPLLGDLDGDDEAGVGDAIKILRIVVGFDDDSPAADANQNCGTDVGDAIKILRIVVGLDTDWPLTWQKAWVSGTVRQYIDQQTASALEGVEATVGLQSDTTESNGEFEIKCVPLGDQTIAVAKDGYEPAGSLPTSVLIEAPRTELAPIYVIMSGNTPPPRP